MTEKDLYPKWKAFIESRHLKESETYELKLVNLTKNKSFVFNRVADHQIDGLMASLEGLYLKIMDQPYMSGGYQQKKPFDSFYVKAKNAYVVVIFYQPRKFKKAFVIPIKTFLDLKYSWPKKSIKMNELEIQVGVEVYSI